MACEGIFIVFIIYYSIEEILEIKKHKLKYFKSFWNVLDIIVIFLGYVAIVFNVYRTLTVNDLLQGLLKNNKQYANFDSLGFWQTQFNNMVAVAVFFAWIKVKIWIEMLPCMLRWWCPIYSHWVNEWNIFFILITYRLFVWLI